MATPRTQELILLVDDEPAIAIILAEYLKKVGFRVISTTSSIEALRMFRELPDQVSLLITDLTMPNLSGIDLVKAIHRDRPDMPVILCTGYGEEIGWQRARTLKLSACLGKPVDRDELRSAVQRALAQAGKTKLPLEPKA